MKLHPEFRNQLFNHIVEHYHQLLVDNNRFLNINSYFYIFSLDAKYSNSNNKNYQKLSDYVGEFPFSSLISNYINRRLAQIQEYDESAKSIPLSEYKGFKRPKIAANNIINYVESLPWKIEYIFEFNSEVAPFLIESGLPFHVAEDIRIESGRDLQGNWPLYTRKKWLASRLFSEQSLGLLLLQPKRREWNKKGAFVRIRRDGYVGYALGSNTFDDVIYEFKSLVGLLIASGLFRVNEKNANSILHKYSASERKSIVYVYDDGRPQIYSTPVVPKQFDSVFQSIDLTEKMKRREAEDRIQEISRHLSFVGRAFAHRKKAEKLRHAAVWLFDSHGTVDYTQSYIQSMICLEIILADKSPDNILGIREIMSNRCAYLLGKTYDQRDQILKEFKIMYDLRSKIIHRGHLRFRSNEKNLLSRLQGLCHMVIFKELTLLLESASE